MGRCLLCGSEGKLISSSLGVCASCLKSRPVEALRIVRRRRGRWRLGLFNLPPSVPGGGRGSVTCRICVNECRIPEGGVGYCGVWANRGGRLEYTAGGGHVIAYTYLDPHPTNCVATPVCPAATDRGYPKYTFTRGVEYGYYNLAVFMGGCPLDCVFCQNWDHKLVVKGGRPEPGYIRDVGELVDEADRGDVTCICYFGGDPTPHTPILLKASKVMLERARAEGRVFRVCWETDGQVNSALARQMALISLESGGIVKVDWKAWTPSIYEALTGVNGVKGVERLKANTRILAGLATRRSEPPLLVVSTLLVPGYVDAGEVEGIAGYIAGLMEEYGINIPMVLLAFYGAHLMKDMPSTSINHAREAVEAAKTAGIKEVYVGNEWLLYY